MKVKLYKFNHNLFEWLSAITAEQYNDYGKTSFFINILFLKHFTLKVWQNSDL